MFCYMYFLQSHKNKSSDNITQITIFVYIFVHKIQFQKINPYTEWFFSKHCSTWKSKNYEHDDFVAIISLLTFLYIILEDSNF